MKIELINHFETLGKDILETDKNHVNTLMFFNENDELEQAIIPTELSEREFMRNFLKEQIIRRGITEYIYIMDSNIRHKNKSALVLGYFRKDLKSFLILNYYQQNEDKIVWLEREKIDVHNFHSKWDFYRETIDPKNNI